MASSTPDLLAEYDMKEFFDTDASAVEAQQEKQKDPWWWRPLGFSILTLSIIGGSSIGAIANFIPVQTSFAKNAWRSGFVTTIFIIPAIIEWLILRKGTKTRKAKVYAEILSFKQYLFICATLVT